MKFQPGTYQQAEDRIHRLQRHNHRHRGFVCQAGLWSPQVQLQITPFCWGLSLGFSRTKWALQVGPVTIALWVAVRGWKAECRTFNDPKV